MTARLSIFPLVFLVAVFSSGCNKGEEAADASSSTGAEAANNGSANSLEEGEEPQVLVTRARATIEPLGDVPISGTVTFAPSDLGIQVTYILDGLGQGTYGFHVHENGSCAAGEDGTPGGAAGGHFNPDSTAHGAPNLSSAQRHVGDLGNIHVLSERGILGSSSDALITLGGPNSIVGKALVIHAGEDDYTSQPSGNSGARIGCGIIESVESD